MNYHLAVDGKHAGIFPEEELRHRRQIGQLSAEALVWREGMADWQPIDQALGLASTPPPFVTTPRKQWPRAVIIIAAICGLMFMVYSAYFIRTFARGFMRGFNDARSRVTQNLTSDTPGMAAASTPVTWPANSLTERDVRIKAKPFRIRQYLDAYKQYGDHTQPCDAEIQQLIDAWLQAGYGGSTGTSNNVDVRALADKLANTPGCNDPIMLTIAATECVEYFEANNRYRRALDAFTSSKYKAYPRLYTTLRFAAASHTKEHLAALDTAAIAHFKEMFEDGSIQPDDQEEIADIMVQGWGEQFFYRHSDVLVPVVEQSGSGFKWLALVLKGRSEIDLAWKARGNGWANTVKAQGWRDFETHLANARDLLTEAWKLRPNAPIAAAQMMNVALGTTGADEMRRWFDRAIAAQMDYPHAWYEMRWGLRPRWHGSEQAVLAFGINGVNTGRFDTDVPRKLMDAVNDIESDRDMLPGHHLYGRADIWPNLQKMYEGYTTQSPDLRDGWRSSYAVVAYLAGHYDVARTQLEKLNWNVGRTFRANWGKDLSLMAEEVAARTGNLKDEIIEAEDARDNGNLKDALALYEKLDGKQTDEHTKKLIQCRISSLQLEQKLRTGEWVDWLPTSEDDPNWVLVSGKYKTNPDGSIDVESGPTGHMLFCRARIGTEYEVKGDIEVLHSSTKSFQGGLVMGLPDTNYTSYANQWFAFRIKRNSNENDIVAVTSEWSTKKLWQRLPLNDVTNSFDFTFHNVKVTATVNGQTVLRDNNIPGPVRVCDADFLVGLGAYNDMNDTTIRYRNVKLRLLNGENAAKSVVAAQR